MAPCPAPRSGCPGRPALPCPVCYHRRTDRQTPHLLLYIKYFKLALVSNKTNIFHYYQQGTTTTTNLGKIEIISSNMNFWPWPLGMVLFWGKIVWQWLMVVTCNGHHHMMKGTYSCILVVYQHIRISFRSTCGHNSQIYRLFKSVIISVWNHCCLMSFFFQKKEKKDHPIIQFLCIQL